MAVLEAPKARSARRVPRVATGLLVAVGVLSLAVAALAGRALLHRGEVMPGVEVLGTDLGGLDAREAVARTERVSSPRRSFAPTPRRPQRPRLPRAGTAGAHASAR